MLTHSVVRSTPVLPQWHVKDPGHSAKSAGGRLNLNTHIYIHTPLDHRSRGGLIMLAVQAWCGNLSGNELTRNSSGNTRPQSSQLAKPLWTDPSIKCGINVRELISTSHKKQKKIPPQAGIECEGKAISVSSSLTSPTKRRVRLALFVLCVVLWPTPILQR